MTANYCKIDTLDLFNDLKDTNISFSEFKSIVAGLISNGLNHLNKNHLIKELKKYIDLIK